MKADTWIEQKKKQGALSDKTTEGALDEASVAFPVAYRCDKRIF